VLFPLFQKAAVTQMAIKKIEPEVAAIKEEYKNKPEEQTRKILELYRVNKVNPFSSILVLFIQIPIILALFWVFRGNFQFDPKELYSFVSLPAVLSTKLFGLIDITSKSAILAILTGLTQYFQTVLTLPPAKPKSSANPSFKEDFARSMNMNMRYFMPVFVGYIAYTLSSAIAIYWLTSNIFAIGQELYIRSSRKD
ncbi:MAG: YidC/Oxa1 family membrane protein insertase, partial [Candidatus Vogelbacteria bacterium]|nr:YidC/Oxa1 family membrane protein insertase [Candidatus Vogelbacteria bacterium]